MRAERWLVVLGVLLLAGPVEARKAKNQPAVVVDPPAQLIGEALTSPTAWERLVFLCDQIGHRLSGSPQLERAVAWARERMEEDGLTDARAEPVEVPVWRRGEESLTLLAPTLQDLDVLATAHVPELCRPVRVDERDVEYGAKHVTHG